MKAKKNRIFWYVLCAIGCLFLNTFVACQCEDNVGVQADGIIKTNLPGEKRPNLIFTNAAVNKQNEQSFDLWNDGRVELTITKIHLKGPGFKSFQVQHPKLPLVLKPGEAKKKITVIFTPKEAGDFEALMGFTSSDAKNVENDGVFYVKVTTQNLAPLPEFDCKKRLEFGKVALGKTLEKTCTIRNVGSADLEIKKIFYNAEKNEVDAYELVEPKTFPVTLKQGGDEKLTVKIRFAPKKYPPAEAVGHFVFETNIKDESDASKHKLKVIGLIQIGAIELIPIYPNCQGHEDCRRVDSRLFCNEDAPTGKKLCRQKATVTPLMKFPLTSKGKSTTRQFLIRSVGELPIEVTKITLGTTNKDFKVLNAGLPLTLAPKSEKSISVTYSPLTDKPGKNVLTVHSSAGNKSKAPVNLEAATHGCDLQANPQKLKFTGPKSFTLTLFNQGNQSCLVKTVKLKSGKEDPFKLFPKVQGNQTIAPGGRLDLLVKFAPKGQQAAKDAVVIESTDPDEPIKEVPLEGKVNGNQECELKASPGNLNFYLLPVGRSRQMRLGLTNVGWGVCRISSMNIVHLSPPGTPAFRLNPNLPKTLVMQAGSSRRLEVSFTPPKASPTYTGKLVIASNDAKNPSFEVKLQGAAGTLCLEVVPPNLDFGSTKVGCSTPKRNIEIYNIGAAGCKSPVRVTSIKCAPTDCFPRIPKAEFRINSAPGFPLDLNNGQKLDIGMSYKAANLGVDTGTLEVHNNIVGQSPIQIPLVGEGVSSDEQKDVFSQLNRPLADILFVIDNSCSMRDEQASLGKNLQAFIQWAVRLNVDFHIGVTTTDVTNRPYPAGCLQGQTKIIKPNTPNAIQIFRNNTNLGTTGSGIERGLEGAYRAMIPPTLNDPKCNRGFYRKAASLSFIFVSDQNDLSTQPVKFYINFFKSIKGYLNLDLVRASVIVGPPPAGCRNPGTGVANSAPRYWQVAKELNGIKESICNSNWAGTLSNIGSITFGYRTQFFLSRQADPRTIKVKVNGNTVKEDPQDGWQYESSNNSINFSKSQTPPPNSTVAVEYKAICLK